MSKRLLSEELMARFYDGETTPEETIKILRAAKEDPELKEEIDFMMSIPHELMDIHVSREEIESAKEVSYLPMWRLAAQSRVYGHEMKAPNDCVIKCEQYVLQLFNIDESIKTLKELSQKNKWLKEGGTPLHHIGRILSEYQLSVVRRYDCDIDILRNELDNDCKIIVAINSDKLNNNETNSIIPNHAVVVLSVNEKEVLIYDPQNAQKLSHSVDSFISAWKDSHYYIVSVKERGKRQYTPAPIDASKFQLSTDLDELIEAIAENNHEVWAKDRKKEGIEYGPVRDEKHNPDMLPYSDLPESEKEYDRKAARGILELVQRLGYKIERKK